MRWIAWGSLRTLTSTTGAVALALGLASACSQGEAGSGFPGYPGGPGGPATSGNSSNSSATFGVDAGEGGPGSCCVANGTPGCEDEFVEACVCADDVDCCSTEWTGECARLVDELGCGQCIGGPETGDDVDPDGGPGGQDCCVGGPDPGCNDPEIEACVCAEIGFCCDTGWEPVCTDAVGALGCGHECNDSPTTGEPPPPPPPGDSSGGEPPPPPPPGMGDCCMAQETGGCADAAIQACVCAEDSYCCDTAWDQLCVDQVAEHMCGDCGGAPPPPPPPPPPGASPCCEAQMGAGCGDADIEACVCAIDDFCCTTEWDAVCAIFVTLFLCDSC